MTIKYPENAAINFPDHSHLHELDAARGTIVLGTDTKAMTIAGESMRVKFLNTELDHATYEFVSGQWAGHKVTVRRIWEAEDTFTLELIFFDDPKETYPLGFVRPN